MQGFIDIRRAPAALSAREIAHNLAVIGLPDGWSLGDDLVLVEGLFRGEGLGRIGAQIGKTLPQVQARFLALRQAAMGGETYLTLTAQERLLEAVWARAKAEMVA